MSDATAAPIANVSMSTDAKANLRDPLKLWGWLRGFSVLFLIGKMISVIVYGALTALGSMYNPALPTFLPLTLSILLLAGLVPLSFLGCIFFTLRLTYRLVKNLKLINSGEMDMGPGTATWSYFVPILNLGIPVQGVGQAWRGTFEALGEDTDPRGVIGWWWATYLTSGALGGISGVVSRAAKASGDIAALAQSAPWTAASAAVLLVSILLFMNIFSKLARAQHRMLQISAFE